MINNKKGLSTIIVTVLLIGLTIVAVGIVWAVVNNVLNRGNQNTDLQVKCLGVDVGATSVRCGTVSQVCNVTLERTGQRSDVIAGVKFVLINSTGSQSTTAADVPGDITPLGSKLFSTAAANFVGSPNRAETTVYFTDVSGNPQNCPQPDVFTF